MSRYIPSPIHRLNHVNAPVWHLKLTVVNLSTFVFTLLYKAKIHGKVCLSKTGALLILTFEVEYNKNMEMQAREMMIGDGEK